MTDTIDQLNTAIDRVLSYQPERESVALPRNPAKQKAEKNPSRKKELIALSLFSGGGGLDLGFSAADFRVACSTDIDTFSCRTLELNNGKKPFYKHAHSIAADIKEVSAKTLLKEANISRGEIDIVLGGPPCQAFSVFGRRKAERIE